MNGPMPSSSLGVFEPTQGPNDVAADFPMVDKQSDGQASAQQMFQRAMTEAQSTHITSPPNISNSAASNPPLDDGQGQEMPQSLSDNRQLSDMLAEHTSAEDLRVMQRGDNGDMNSSTPHIEVRVNALNAIQCVSSNTLHQARSLLRSVGSQREVMRGLSPPRIEHPRSTRVRRRNLRFPQAIQSRTIPSSVWF